MSQPDAMTSAAMTPRFDMSRVARRTFGSIGRNWAVFFGLAVLLTGIPQALLQFAVLQGRLLDPTLTGAPFAWTSLPTSLLLAAASAVLQAALVHGTVMDLNGRKASFGDCLATGMRFFLPVIGIAIMESIALVFGFVLLVVPGIIMAMAWLVAVPAEVTERTGLFGAFSRSAELTRNHRWSLLGMCVIYVVLITVIAGVVGGVFGAASVGAWATETDRITFVQAASSLIVQPLQTMIATAGIASVYYELRSVKDGIGPDALASVFD